MAAQHFAFEKVIVIVGVLPVTGFHEGDDVIALEREVDLFSVPVGAGGQGTFVQNANRAGSIKLKLQQASPSNVALSLLVAAAEAGVFTTFPFLLKDAANLADLATAPQCVIQRPANKTYGANQTVREWTLLTDQLFMAG